MIKETKIDSFERNLRLFQQIPFFIITLGKIRDQ